MAHRQIHLGVGTPLRYLMMSQDSYLAQNSLGLMESEG
jgi:hypothetical protein